MSEPIKPVSEPSFWRGRILTALATGKELHTIIYDTDYANWQSIQDHTRSGLADLLVDGDRLLDAGCGYGAIYETLPEDIKVDYVGVDISPDLIDLGHIRNPQADLRLGNLRDLDFPTDCFDYALCRSIRSMIIDNQGQQEWRWIALELLRVSKRLVLLEYSEPSFTNWRIIDDPQAA